MRSRLMATALVLVLLTVSLPVPSGQATASLVADAGESRTALGGGTLDVEGRAFGGIGDHAWSWTIDGEASRFDAATEQETTVDLDGLAGVVEITLTVTDEAGSTAVDTVLYHVAPGQVLADTTGTVALGLPDEEVGQSGELDGSTTLVPFTVPQATSNLEATLGWTNDQAVLLTNDLDLTLVDPTGQEHTPSEPTGSAETITLTDPVPGDWTARVEAWRSTPETWELGISGFVSPTMPDARLPGPMLFGELDDQVLHGLDKSGQEAQASWDLDLDGVYETQGTVATAGFAPGTSHEVAFKLTDATGFEDRITGTVQIKEAIEHVLPLRCPEDETRPFQAMEYELSDTTCWMHSGHHTYFLEDAWQLLGGQGRIVSVEQQFSPPTEYQLPSLDTPIHVQTSQDGRTWTELESVSYTFAGPPLLDTRQAIEFELPAAEEPVRYLRFHQPRSAAQGLSGFLDNSRIELFANATEAGPVAGGLEATTRTLSCLDGAIMEDFFESHPCTFGGINRYDAPSFLHTYILGDPTPARVDHVEATVDLAPWRTDDWFLFGPPIGSEAHLEQTTTTQAFLETSVDGATWTRHHATTVVFGVPTTVSVDLDHEPARFLRIVPDLHPRFQEFREFPALHHPEAYLLFSEITVTGDLPTASGA